MTSRGNGASGASALRHWKDSLRHAFGVQAELSPLDGEHDLNYAIEEGGRRTGVLKVMRAGCALDLIEMQCAVLEHLAASTPEIPAPRLIRTLQGEPFKIIDDQDGQPRLVWMISWLPGRLYIDLRPKPLPLIERIGQVVGKLDRALETFPGPVCQRKLKWDVRHAAWIREHIPLHESARRRSLVTAILDAFEGIWSERLASLSSTPVHGDIVDHNVLIEDDPQSGLQVSGIIDFGDMVSAPKIYELAVAGAYCIFDQRDRVKALAALVKGYHLANPLSDEEIELIYPLLLTRLAVSVTVSALVKRERPNDAYVTISEANAWEFLENSADISPAWVLANLRRACGLSAVRRGPEILAWLSEQRGRFAPVVAGGLEAAPVLDLSVGACLAPEAPFDMKPGELARAVAELSGGAPVAIGRHGEPRLLYGVGKDGESPFVAGGPGAWSLGVDIFASAGTRVMAPCKGEAHAVAANAGVLTLKHAGAGNPFYTVYTHLSPDSLTQLVAGDPVDAGQVIGTIDAECEDEKWPAHLHVRLALDEAGADARCPDAAQPDDAPTWKEICPNPAALLNLSDEAVEAQTPDIESLAEERWRHSPRNLKLFYKKPLAFARGWKHYLFDAEGRVYLDAYNNVPHAGHAHPRIAAVAARQMKLLNTNTRYLYPQHVAYAQALTDRFPGELKVCLFVNSGAEANELAVRLARAYTGATDTIVMAGGYHGATNTMIDISEYKFNGPGGRGAPNWVHVVPIPDDYRGEFKRSDPEAGAKYATYAARAADEILAKGRKLACFIAETFPSVGGQIIPPPGYLRGVYDAVRRAGGLCIADEVQTGLGRIGGHFWAFEAQGAVPDIVVLGKPLGNGHPMAAVITTQEIAAHFVTGMEFFSTFGGSTLSCVIGHELLRIIDDEGLQANARTTGEYLRKGLAELAQAHPIIGDIRAMGLFLGVELVADRDTLEPATAATGYILNRLRERRILTGVEGFSDNVLKIRPPLTFSRNDADTLLQTLDRILHEDPCRAY